MTVQEAVSWLKKYQGYEPMTEADSGHHGRHKHFIDLSDEMVDTLLAAIETGKAVEKAQSPSGLLVEGAEMPTGCGECFCCQPDAHFCRYTCGVLNEDVMDDDTGELFTDRPPWCPLKEVVHGEYQ